MPVRTLLDQGLPPDAARILRDYGWDAVHVREIGMREASDADILARGLADDRFCVTLDKDFHEALAASGDTRPSVVLFRIQGLRAQSCADLLVRIHQRHSEELHSGHAITVTTRAMRVRRLPL